MTFIIYYFNVWLFNRKSKCSTVLLKMSKLLIKLRPCYIIKSINYTKRYLFLKLNKLSRTSKSATLSESSPLTTSTTSPPVNSDPQLKPVIGFVPNLENFDRVEKLQGHRRDLGRVTISVSSRKTRYDHVSVADRFNLKDFVFPFQLILV